MTSHVTVATNIASIAHEANRRFQVILADPSIPVSPPWDTLDSHTKGSAVDGVLARLSAPAGSPASASHDNWLAFKTRAGWVYGPVKDEVAKTHPLMVPYELLTLNDRLKDALFCAVVDALSPLIPQVEDEGEAEVEVDIEIEIDMTPLLPPVVEISREDIDKTIARVMEGFGLATKGMLGTPAHPEGEVETDLDALMRRSAEVFTEFPILNPDAFLRMPLEGPEPEPEPEGLTKAPWSTPEAPTWLAIEHVVPTDGSFQTRSSRDDRWTIPIERRGWPSNLVVEVRQTPSPITITIDADTAARLAKASPSLTPEIHEAIRALTT